MLNKKDIYNHIIKTLQVNDRNATFDEILSDCENNLDEAIRIVYSCLYRVVYDEDLEGEELDFYKKQLESIMKIYKPEVI